MDSEDGSLFSILRRGIVLTGQILYDVVAAVAPFPKSTGRVDSTGSVTRGTANGRPTDSSRSKQGTLAPGGRKAASGRKRRDPGTLAWSAALLGRVRTFSAQVFGTRRLLRGYDYSAAIPPGKRKTLVLDLDETLIHSTSRGSRNHDHVIEVLVDKHVCLYYIYKRPFVDFFLRKVSEWYNVVIFTASMPEYADPVIDYLDVTRTLINRRYFRQSCTQHNGTYIKDLAIIEPDLSKVLLIDNSPISYAINQDNGIPIEGWISDPLDESLLDLLPFLDSLRYVDDVRSVLSLRI